MKPTREAIDKAITEFVTSRSTSLVGALGQIETAIYLEETFGFVLSDGEISMLTPADPAEIGRVVRKKMGA